MDRTRQALPGLVVAVDTAVDGLLSEWVSGAQADRVRTILHDFARFCERGHGLDDLALVTPAVADAFIRAPLPDGREPSVSLMHLRRSALRLLFRSARHLGQAVGDPTLDLRLPRRAPLTTRP